MSHFKCFARLAAALLPLFGCARLNVSVDILNSAYWSSPQYVESITVAKISDTEQAIRDGRFMLQREALKNDVRDKLLEMAENNPKNKPEDVGVPLKFVDPLAKALNATIDSQFSVARGYFRGAFDKLEAATLTSTQTDRASKMQEAKALFTQGADTLAVLVNDLSKAVLAALTSGDLRAARTEPPPAAIETVDRLKKNAEEDIQGLIGDAGILDDPRAATVVYAPNEHWTGQFNGTLCSGWFGNSDCAVKMEGLGSFTLKGVRLDATKITQATFSVAKETIQIAAAAYGVPIPKSQPAAGAGVSDSTASTDIGSAVKRQRDAGTAMLQLRLPRLSMFEIIIGQRKSIAGNDAARAQAIKTIKTAIDANRKQLDPTPAK